MIQALMFAALTVGLAQTEAPKSNAAVDGVWTVVAMEVNGRPSTLTEKDSGLAIRNSTLTLPGIASMHGVIRLELSPKGMLRAIPAARGTGNRRDLTDSDSGVGGASGIYIRTADYLVLTIGDPTTATATGTGVGAETRATTDPANPAPAEKPQPSVGTPPVSLVLKRSTGADAAPSTAAVPPPPPPSANTPANSTASLPNAPAANGSTPQRISTMMGSTVTLSDGTSAGAINDFVLGDNGTFAVLDSAGTFSAVPFSALSFGATAGAATIPLTRAQFSTVPTFGANDLSNFLQNPAFFTRVENTFVGFRDINGNPVFNSIGMNTLTNRGQPQQNQPGNQAGNQIGNRAGNQPGNQTGNQPGTQTGNRPAGQPGTTPGGTGVPGGKAVPGGTDPNTIPGNPAPPQGQPPSAQPKGQPPAAQPKGQPPAGQPKGNAPGGVPKAPPKGG